MKKIQSMLSRYRLLTSVLALALALGALATTPATAQDPLMEEGAGGWRCQPMGCVLWSDNVCYKYRTCCVNGQGGYKCYDS